MGTLLFQFFERPDRWISKNHVQHTVLSDTTLCDWRGDHKFTSSKSSHIDYRIKKLLVGDPNTLSLHPVFQYREKMWEAGTKSHVSKEDDCFLVQIL